jgi:hypothetical protein
MSKSIKSIVNKYVKNKESIFQLQYVDYKGDTWTMPCLLTAQRAERFMNDRSVSKIKVKYKSEEFIITP